MTRLLVLFTPALVLFAESAMADDPTESARAAMVRDQIAARGIRDREVLRAMSTVPRHRFMPEDRRDLAYGDHPVSIGDAQTISQPYIVALMTDLSGASSGSRVLEVGTGSGYQAAVLAEVGADVYSIEIIAALGKRARRDLDATGYSRVETRIGDGYRGWPTAAPFDAIVVTAAPETVPAPLLDQLKVGGRLVIPVGGSSHQELKVITRTVDGYDRRSVIPVLFVPMTGESRGDTN